MAVWAGPSYAMLQEQAGLREDLDTLTQMNLALSERARLLERDIYAMRHSPAYQELVVRDELGYVRAGDLVLVGVP